MHNPLFYVYDTVFSQKKKKKNTQCFQKRIMSSVFLLLLLLLFHPQGMKRLVSHVKCGVLTCCLGADRLICFLMLHYCLCLSFKTSLPLAVGGCKSISAVQPQALSRNPRGFKLLLFTQRRFLKRKQASLLQEILRLMKGAVLSSLLSVELDLCVRRQFACVGQDFLRILLSQIKMFLNQCNENAFMHVFSKRLFKF